MNSNERIPPNSEVNASVVSEVWAYIWRLLEKAQAHQDEMRRNAGPGRGASER